MLECRDRGLMRGHPPFEGDSIASNEAERAKARGRAIKGSVIWYFKID